MGGSQPGRAEGSTPPDQASGGRQGDHHDLLPATRRVSEGGGRSLAVVVALVAVAFLVGLLRPWDLLGLGDRRSPTTSPGVTRPSSPAEAIGLASAPPDAVVPTGTPPPAADVAAAATCAYPQSWRAATIQDWAGRTARVWTAVDATPASGPLDPAITFQVIGGDRFTALGWCAAVLGDERPPDDAVGHLYRIEGGKATELAAPLLEPAAPNPLAGLWGAALGTASPGGSSATPRASSSLAALAGLPAWPTGRYVIEVSTPDGRWRRCMGIELRLYPGARPSDEQASSAPSSTSP